MADFTSRFNELLTRSPGNDSDLATALGVSKQTISAWKNGTRFPKRPAVKTIADYFNVSVPWLEGITDVEMETQRNVFVKNLTRIMKARGVDQSDIVVAVDVSSSTVSDWINGKKYPCVDAMQRLADYLGVLMSDLTVDQDKVHLSAASPADPQEAELVAIYRDLNDGGQTILLNTARGLAANPDMKRGGASNTETA